MAKAHAMLQADLDDTRVAKGTKRIEQSLEAMALKGARSFAMLDQANASMSSKMTQRLVSDTSRMRGGAGRGGMAALQVQDIAVQLQMGTRLSTIIAQQGSQLASVLGPGGMVLGAAVAIGGALFTVGMNANDAFDKIIIGARESRKEIGKLISTGGVQDLTRAIEQLQEQQDALSAVGKTGGVLDVLKGGLGILAGGKSRAEQESAALLEQGNAYWKQVEVRQKLLEMSDREVNIAKLRAMGREKEAAAQERQIALEKQIASIQASGLDRSAKDKLIANVEAVSASKERGRLRMEAEARRNDWIATTGAGINNRAAAIMGTSEDRSALRRERNRAAGLNRAASRTTPTTAEERAQRRAAEEEVNELDRRMRAESGITSRVKGLTPQERRKQVEARIEAAKLEKQGKLDKLTIDKDAVQVLVDAIDKLLTR